MKEIFIKNLKYLRKYEGFSQDRLSEKLSIKRCTIAAYEEGRAEPCIGRFLQICKFFQVDPRDMYFYDFENDQQY
jgi:transcriptional regulator with XRE-family HTH domain